MREWKNKRMGTKEEKPVPKIVSPVPLAGKVYFNTSVCLSCWVPIKRKTVCHVVASKSGSIRAILQSNPPEEPLRCWDCPNEGRKLRCTQKGLDSHKLQDIGLSDGQTLAANCHCFRKYAKLPASEQRVREQDYTSGIHDLLVFLRYLEGWE